MANVLEIDEYRSINLDKVFLVEANNITEHVVVYQEAGGTGYILPTDITYEDVLYKMRNPN